MKIKKVNELASEYSEEQLKNFRLKHFGDKDEVYHVWGEILKYTVPEYSKLTTLYSIDACINWYNTEKKNKNSRMNQFDNVIFVKEIEKIDILDFDLLLQTNKYNL